MVRVYVGFLQRPGSTLILSSLLRLASSTGVDGRDCVHSRACSAEKRQSTVNSLTGDPTDADNAPQRGLLIPVNYHPRRVVPKW
jgi:hypothetical protein